MFGAEKKKRARYSLALISLRRSLLMKNAVSNFAIDTILPIMRVIRAFSVMEHHVERKTATGSTTTTTTHNTKLIKEHNKDMGKVGAERCIK